jgi:hypothetical protein
MSPHIEQSILELQEHLAGLEDQARDTKKAVNALCRVAGKPAIYTDLDAEGRIVSAQIRGDEYYGKPLATVVREILEKRHRLGIGPASVDELYDDMLEGGYQFDGKNPHNAKRSLRISLAKNTSTFHRLPNRKIGLREWYPGLKEAKSKPFAEAVEELAEEEEAAAIEEIVAPMDSVSEGKPEVVAPKPK